MSAGRDALAERDQRLFAHCREGYRLARRDASYRANVLERSSRELPDAPDDLWKAIPWVWTVTVGGAPPRAGPMSAAIDAAAALLAEELAGDEPFDVVRSRWAATPALATQLALGSIVRSHPFSDLRAWSLRPTSAA